MTALQHPREGDYIPSPKELPKTTDRWMIEVPEGARVDTYWIRGYGFYPEGVKAATVNSPVTEFQLVPEPGNPWDHGAVAVYARGLRVGYIGREHAEWLHQGIRAHNRRGRAVMIRGLLRQGRDPKAELHFDGSGFTGWASAPGLLESSGIVYEVRQMVSAFVEDITWEYLLDSPDEEEMFRKLRQYAHHAPSLTWPCHAWEGDADFFVPDLVYQMLWRRIGSHRRALKKQAQEARREARRLKQEAKQKARAAREQALLNRKQEARNLLRAGSSIAAAARAVGLGETTVSKLAREEGHHPQTNPEGKTNDELRMERVRTCLGAVDLQRSGMSRADIAHALAVASIESVKVLLRDGKFYEDPAAYPERLAETLAAEFSSGSSQRDKARRRDLRVIKDLHPSIE